MKIEKCLRIVISIIVLSVIIWTGMPNCVNASFTISDLTGDTSGKGSLVTMGNKVIQIISTVGSILSVIVIIVLGIKYMMGSVEEKANYKKTLLPFLIGAAFIFAASSIANVVYQVAINL